MISSGHAVAEQLMFFENHRPLNGGFRDPAFTENRLLPLHRWVPWVAGFSSTFVDDALARFLRDSDCIRTVLDPFAGVGTTLVQAFQRGLDVVGFEVNPYAALATRLKLASINVDVRKFETIISDYQTFSRLHVPSVNGAKPFSTPPEGFKSRHPFFSQRVEKKVLFTLDYIASIRDELCRNLFRLAFGAIMVKVSNYSYEPSLGRRAASGKPDVEDADVRHVMTQKLSEMLDDITWLQKKMSSLSRVSSHKVYAQSFFKAGSYLKPSTIDLVVTSPPYLNNYHYVRNTRPQMYWLGLTSNSDVLSQCENSSFGKFWQTVREKKPISLCFRLPELERVLQALREANPHKGIYGGGGWANYAATYFNDCFRFAKLLKIILKPRAHAVVVLGNSILQGVEIKTEYFFGEITKLNGLQLVGIELLRKKRTGTSIVNSSVRANPTKTKSVLSESAVIVRR